jgi:hypothetical protein
MESSFRVVLPLGRSRGSRKRNEGHRLAALSGDENDQPIAEISGLIESVLETEPSGKEMRPSPLAGDGMYGGETNQMR